MKAHDPELARAIASSLERFTDSELARYLHLVSTLAAYARFQHQARQARHAGCISAAREFETIARDTLNRYARYAQTVNAPTLAQEVTQ